jgi:hypothetical protein
MKQNMYSVYDTVAETFNIPFKELNNASAIRSFQHSVIEQPHKDDYALYFVGTFDDDSGRYEIPKEPLRLLTGLEVQVKQPDSLVDQAV